MLSVVDETASLPESSSVSPPTGESDTSMGTGSETDNSSDQEKEATNTGSTIFTNDTSSKNDKTKLANRVLMEDFLIGDSDHKTRLLERIGGGSFGEIYLGELMDSKRKVAVKIEPMDCVMQFLLHEGDVYRKLEAAGVVGLPRSTRSSRTRCSSTVTPTAPTSTRSRTCIRWPTRR